MNFTDQDREFRTNSEEVPTVAIEHGSDRNVFRPILQSIPTSGTWTVHARRRIKAIVALRRHRWLRSTPRTSAREIADVDLSGSQWAGSELTSEHVRRRGGKRV
jgi:hypothetical protein